MTGATAKLTDQILSLPCEDRIYMVDKLLKSLNAPSHDENDRLWAAETEKRIDELDSGKVQSIPGDQVLAELRKKLGR
jgi:putative addiction module component (TIGR02574 family)